MYPLRSANVPTRDAPGKIRFVALTDAECLNTITDFVETNLSGFWPTIWRAKRVHLWQVPPKNFRTRRGCAALMIADQQIANGDQQSKPPILLPRQNCAEPY